MKNSKRNEIVFPGSYRHLQQLALKGKKLKCDCRNSPHMSDAFSVTLFFSILAVLASCLFVALGFLGKEHRVSYFCATGVSAITALALILILKRLRLRDWLAHHSDQVIKEFIPAYLIGQKLLMQNSLLAENSPLRSAMRKVVDIESQAMQVKRIIEQFSAAGGGVKQLPSYLSETLAQAKVCLGFAQTRHLLVKSETLILAYLQTKYGQVLHFQKLVNENLKTDIAMKLMQFAWLEQVWTVLRDLEELRKVFDRNFDKHLSDYVTQEASSGTVEIARQKAQALYAALDDYYGDVLSSTTADESPAAENTNEQ